VQLVAFPQNGTSHDPNARSWMERALDDGCTVVGGCPYADPDPSAHLDLVFGLAADSNLNPWTEAKVDTKNPDRGPLLILEGEKDNTVPWGIA
jgi:hypothetical protein